MSTLQICLRSLLLLSVCGAIGAACSDWPTETERIELAIEPPKPILEGYTADPHAVVFGDTAYVYPTSDKDGWQTTDFWPRSSPPGTSAPLGLHAPRHAGLPATSQPLVLAPPPRPGTERWLRQIPPGYA